MADSIDNSFSKIAEESDKMEWVPLTLTLVEYPKGACTKL